MLLPAGVLDVLKRIRDTSRQQLGCTLPDTVNPDDGRKHCLKHVELT